MPSASPWVCFAVRNEIPPRQIPIARRTPSPRAKLARNIGTSWRAKSIRTLRNAAPNTRGTTTPTAATPSRLDDLERAEHGRRDEDEERVPDVHVGEGAEILDAVDDCEHDVHEDENEGARDGLHDRIEREG